MSSYGGHQSWGREDGGQSWGRHDSWGRRGNRGWHDNSYGGWKEGGGNRGWNRRQGGGRNRSWANSAQGSGQHPECGPGTGLSVSGCVDPVVGPIIRGSYTSVAENHDRPVYKKLEQAKGLEGQLLDVMIYFWDDPSDASFCGWWFGPKVGGDQVWAYHPTQSASTPPTTGWKVPFDGDVDTTMVLATGPVKHVPPVPPKPPAPPPKPKDDDGPPPGIWQQPDSNGAGQQEAGRKRESDALPAIEARKVPRVSKEEDDKRRQEQSAVLAIKRVVQRVKLAKPDTFEALAGELAKVLEDKSSAAGSQAVKVCEEAAKALEQAKQRVGLATKHLQKVGEQRQEVEKDRKERREAVKGLLQQLEALVVKLERETETLRMVGIDLQGDREADDKIIDETLERISRQTAVCKDAYEACTEFNKTNLEKASGLLLESRQELDALMQRADTSSRSREPLRQAAERSRMQALERRETARQAAARKATAEAWVQQQRRLFESYDKDCDGALNRREVIDFAKSEFGVEMPSEALDRIFLEPAPLPIVGTPGAAEEAAQAAVPERSPEPRAPQPGMEVGVQFADFHQLKVIIGVAREAARDAIRRVENQERRRVLAHAREGRRVLLREAAEAIEAATSVALQAEAAAQELLKFGESLEAMESAPCARAARAADEALEAARSSFKAAEQRMADGAEAASPDDELRPEVDILLEGMSKLHNKVVRATNRNGVFWRRMDELRRAEDEAVHNRIMSLLRGQLESGDNRRQRSEILFAKIDANADGKVEQDDLVNFLQGIWGEESFPRDAVVRWFEQLEGDDTTFIVPDTLHRLVRTCYKVLEVVAMTDKLAVGLDEVVIKQLAVNDVVEMYDEPKEVGDNGTVRLRARALTGGEVGYVTVKGNNGNAYLDTGGNHFTVDKDVALTESFELPSSEAGGVSEAASSKPISDVKAGEILEVLQHAKKDEASGSMRMKVKMLSKGTVGWATSVDAQGTVYLKPI